VNQPSKPVAAGLILALSAILLGFGLGGAFGAVESSIKGRLDASYAGDPASKEAVVKKSWEYLQRAHLHGGAIGTAALSSITLLIVLGRSGLVAQWSSAAFGAGALIYSLFWLFAGLKAPGLGSTGAAKEALKFMAVPGAGLCMAGLLGTIASVVSCCRRKA
jgi:hypothetical protein